MSLIAPILQSSPNAWPSSARPAHTVASYRDTLRLLLGFMQQRTAKPPSRLGWEDLDAAVICAFLDHLEADRRNSPRTRNARLTAIRSLFAYAALHHPEHAALIARVLAIPLKRFDRATVSFSARPRSTRCWPRPIAPGGRAGAITPCCSSRSKPVCGSQNSLGSTAVTSPD